MIRWWRRAAGAFDPQERRRLAGFYSAVLLLHLGGWGLLLAYGVGRPAFVGLGFLAYSFGLRHAFDADHISAIDNTTRKLLQQGQKPVGVGFFFSVGHAGVVVAIAVGLAVAVRTVVQSVVNGSGELHDVGGLVGTTVSGAFLLAIGAVNLLVLLDITRVYRRMRRGYYDHASLASLQQELVAGGPFSRLFGRLFALIGASWQLVPVGFLFGLGFDTVTEVTLLGVSAGAAARGLPFTAVLALPIVFGAGMSLMDTTDGAFMSKAYAWAFSHPIRKVFYNLTMTSLSVFVALFVGLLQIVATLTQIANLDGGLWETLGSLDFETLGFVIAGAFVVTWAAAFVYFKVGRVEERWHERMASASGSDGGAPGGG
ncbi:MAG: HoxN/HupN/NixA family nickel/cobalt transporter [bacterium]|nr:HoxN/HupN/NixA family nickel/cobalt transporter [bacterium]